MLTAPVNAGVRSSRGCGEGDLLGAHGVAQPRLFEGRYYVEARAIDTGGALANREALQATKVLAHDEQTLEKHALLNAHTKAWPGVQEEVVQNRQRNVVTQAWGEIPETTPTLSLPQNVSMKVLSFQEQ